MTLDNDRISIRQMFIMFIMTTFSPAIRVFPALCARYGGRAGWLGPVAAGAALAGLVAALARIFRRGAPGDLGDAIEMALGRVGRQIALSVYLVWTLLLYAIYIRYYAERLMSTIFPLADIRFFLITMLILVYAAARGRIESLARFSEISALIFSAVFAIVFILFIPSVKIENLLPLAPGDIAPAARSALPVVGIWGYFTLFFFLGGHVKNKDEMRKHARPAIIYLAAVTALTLFFIIGALGYRSVMRMPAPFFNAIKLIQIVRSFDRLETILLSLWVVSDFITILAFTFIVMNIAKKLFNASKARRFASPVILFGYAGGLAVAANGLELERFTSSAAAAAMNILTGVLFPIAVFLMGKLRGKWGAAR
jgi:spore germination protein (amino acid permease)